MLLSLSLPVSMGAALVVALLKATGLPCQGLFNNEAID